MIRAKAARKWHAAQLRQLVRRCVQAAVREVAERVARRVMIRVVLEMGALEAAFARAAQAASEASEAMHGFGRVIDGESRRLDGVLELPPGQLFAREPDGTRRHLGTTGPIRLLAIDRDPQPFDVDLEERAAAEGFGLVVPDYCGTCGEPILDDELTGTTCACRDAGQA